MIPVRFTSNENGTKSKIRNRPTFNKEIQHFLCLKVNYAVLQNQIVSLIYMHFHCFCFSFMFVAYLP